jgi:hypothetical protein
MRVMSPRSDMVLSRMPERGISTIAGLLETTPHQHRNRVFMHVLLPHVRSELPRQRDRLSRYSRAPAKKTSLSVMAWQIEESGSLSSSYSSIGGLDPGEFAIK